MKSAGAFVLSGRLLEPETATVVRVADGDVMTTDGPFAESKEHLGGFYIIEAPPCLPLLGATSQSGGGTSRATPLILPVDALRSVTSCTLQRCSWAE